MPSKSAVAESPSTAARRAPSRKALSKGGGGRGGSSSATRAGSADARERGAAQHASRDSVAERLIHAVLVATRPLDSRRNAARRARPRPRSRTGSRLDVARGEGAPAGRPGRAESPTPRPRTWSTSSAVSRRKRSRDCDCRRSDARGPAWHPSRAPRASTSRSPCSHGLKPSSTRSRSRRDCSSGYAARSRRAPTPRVWVGHADHHGEPRALVGSRRFEAPAPPLVIAVGAAADEDDRGRTDLQRVREPEHPGRPALSDRIAPVDGGNAPRVADPVDVVPAEERLARHRADVPAHPVEDFIEPVMLGAGDAVARMAIVSGFVGPSATTRKE